MKPQIILKFLITLSLIVFLNSSNCNPEDPEDICNENRDIVTSTGELIVNNKPMWQMSVANAYGATLVADKNCHAKMTLEFYFKKKELAMKDVKPPILITFNGGGGFFDPGSVAVYSKQISDNSYLWTAYCDQAAKNAPSNPIDYSIFVTFDPDQILSLEDVVLSGSINYKIYENP